MSDRERCGDCVHISEKSKTGYHTCEWPVPYWANPPQIVDPDRMITCPTFSQRMEVIHITRAIDENCEHVWGEEPENCELCGLSFQRYIHSCCP